MATWVQKGEKKAANAALGGEWRVWPAQFTSFNVPFMMPEWPGKEQKKV